jgi:hypothetical protein
MSLNLGNYLRNNPNALETKDGKVYVKIPFEEIVKAIKDGMDERAKKVIDVSVEGNTIIISFDTATLLGATDLSKLIPK